MKINVTQQDINSGLIGEICSCPVALAVSKALNKTIYVDYMPSDNTILFYNGDEDFICGATMPFLNLENKELTKWINDFDNGIKVEPFSFVLENSN